MAITINEAGGHHCRSGGGEGRQRCEGKRGADSCTNAELHKQGAVAGAGAQQDAFGQLPGFRCTHTRRMRNVRKAQQKAHEKSIKKRRTTKRQTLKKHALLRKTKTQRNAQKSASTCRTPLSLCTLPFPSFLLSSCSSTFCFSLFHSAVNVFIAVKLVDNAPRMQKGSRAQSSMPSSLPRALTTPPHFPSGRGKGGKGERGKGQ